MGICRIKLRQIIVFMLVGTREFSVRAHQFLGEKLDNVSKHIQSEIEAETGAEAGLKSLIPRWRGKKDE